MNKFICAGLVIERSRVQIPAGAAGEFSSPGSTFCADSYFGSRSTPVLPQRHVKDPGHFAKSGRKTPTYLLTAKSAGGRLQLNTHTPYVCGFPWSAWLYDIHRTFAETAAASCGTMPCQRCKYTTSVDIKKNKKKGYKKLVSHAESHAQHSESDQKSGE